MALDIGVFPFGPFPSFISWFVGLEQRVGFGEGNDVVFIYWFIVIFIPSLNMCVSFSLRSVGSKK